MYKLTFLFTCLILAIPYSADIICVVTDASPGGNWGSSKKPHLDSAKNADQPQLIGWTATDYIVVINCPLSLADRVTKVEITKTRPWHSSASCVLTHHRFSKQSKPVFLFISATGQNSWPWYWRSCQYFKQYKAKTQPTQRLITKHRYCTFQEHYGVFGPLTPNKALKYFSILRVWDLKTQKILWVFGLICKI